MAIVERKERYRRRAALCYEIAATLTGERAVSMIRLGDTYAALAVPDQPLPNIAVRATKNADPRCKKCRSKLRLIHSFPRTEFIPEMQAFQCDACGETLISKGEVRSPRPATEGPAARLSKERDGRITRCFAVSFRRVGKEFLLRPAVECPDAGTAIQRAELMTRDKENAGSVAFSLRSDPVTGEFEPALILNAFGEIPQGFDVA
jgi:hypothetical protein